MENVRGRIPVFHLGSNAHSRNIVAGLANPTATWFHAPDQSAEVTPGNTRNARLADQSLHQYRGLQKPRNPVGAQRSSPDQRIGLAAKPPNKVSAISRGAL